MQHPIPPGYSSFDRYPVTTRVLKSVCTRCGQPVAWSTRGELLSIAERAHAARGCLEKHVAMPHRPRPAA